MHARSSSRTLPRKPMSTILRSLLRSPALRSTPLALRRPLAQPVVLRSTLLHARTVASSVSGKPGSQTFEHAALNIKEEIGNSATDLAKVIAAANVTQDAVSPTGASFVRSRVLVSSSILFLMVMDICVAWNHVFCSIISPQTSLSVWPRWCVLSQSPVDRFMRLLNSGGLPYLGASATTVYLAHQAGLAATGVTTHIDPGVALTILDQALNFQVTYGAVMLSFLGQFPS